jgi:uncharacterized membrane protein
MSTTFFTVLLWTAAIGSGLMAGVYFAFSGFTMKSFGSQKTAQSIAAMNSINETILRSWFMPLFFGSTIVSVLLVLVSIANWGEAGSGLGLIAGIVYFIGMFVSTVLFNVPLNNSLSRQDPDSANAGQVWSHYLSNWTRWNHLRTVSSLVTFELSIWLLNNQ